MASTNNQAVDYTEGYSAINYNGTIDLSDGLTDSHYTQAFAIAESNQTPAGFHGVASGGGGTDGHVTVNLQVSNDGENWDTVSSIVDLDADSGGQSDFGLVGDSSTSTEAFKSYKWARLEAAGQTSNDDDTVKWSLHAPKNEQALASTTSAGQTQDV